jgi:hypothetical protein
VPTRPVVVGAAPARTPRFQSQAAPSFNDPLRRAAVGPLSPLDHRRLVAHYALAAQPRQVAGAATEKHRLAAHRPNRPADRVLPEAPVPDHPTVRTGPDRASRARIFMPEERARTVSVLLVDDSSSADGLPSAVASDEQRARSPKGLTIAMRDLGERPRGDLSRLVVVHLDPLRLRHEHACIRGVTAVLDVRARRLLRLLEEQARPAGTPLRAATRSSGARAPQAPRQAAARRAPSAMNSSTRKKPSLSSRPTT